MTARAKAAISRFESKQFELRDKVVARLKEISPTDRFKVMINAGVLTKDGKLTAAYKTRKAVTTR